MHVRNTSDRYACLELGILVSPVFTNILFPCLLFEKWFTIQNHLLACSLKNGLQIQNHLVACSLKNGLQFKTICLFFNNRLNQNHLLVFQIWFTIKTIKYQCKTVYNNNTLVFGKIGLEHSPLCFPELEHNSTTFPPLLLAYTLNEYSNILIACV